MRRRLFRLSVLALGVCVAFLPARAQDSPDVAQRKLLTDKSAGVRLRAALSLAEANDAQAVSTLIALLAELPEDSAREAEGFLNELAGDQAPNVAVDRDQRSRDRARDAWTKWWQNIDDAELLKELEGYTPTAPFMAKTAALIEQLGDGNFAAREMAEAELKKLGPLIRRQLQTALKDKDLEVRERSRRLLAQLDNDKFTPLSPTIPRLLAIRKPKGTVEAILAIMPFTEDESLLNEFRYALNANTYSNGKAHPDVVKALSDNAAVRRAAAAAALCCGPLTAHRPMIRKLLEDSDTHVRLETALALASAKDSEAVPALIRLVGQLPQAEASAAEAYLYELAGDNLPKNLPEGDADQRKRSELWFEWYEQNQKTLVMPNRATRSRELGYTLTVMTGAGTIREVDRSKKVRWEIKDVFAKDARVLPGNRVLIAESSGKITERNFKGDVLWERTIPFDAYNVERLKNGNTFASSMLCILEFTRDGREVVHIKRPLNDVLTARRLTNGQIAVLTNKWELQRLNDEGEVQKTVKLPFIRSFDHRQEIRDDGSVLVPIQWKDIVIEYNPEGKEVRRYKADSPASVVKLPSGNLLLCEGEGRAYEITRQGKIIWECESGFNIGVGVDRARRR